MRVLELEADKWESEAMTEKPKLGGEVRREERLSSRTRVCADRAGAYDDLSEGFFRLPSPPTPVRPESHKSLGPAGLTRPTRVDELG
jgi:hypothetical protein